MRVLYLVFIAQSITLLYGLLSLFYQFACLIRRFEFAVCLSSIIVGSLPNMNGLFIPGSPPYDNTIQLRVPGSEFVLGPFEGASIGSEGPGEPVAEVSVDLLGSLHVRAVGSLDGHFLKSRNE